MPLYVGLIGVGTVGRAFLERLDGQPATARRLGIAIGVRAAVDSRGAAVAPPGGLLSPRQLLAAKRRAGRVDAVPDGGRPTMAAEAAIAQVPVDAWLELTPSELSTGEPGLGHVRRILAAGRAAVLANKGPLVAAFSELTATARAGGLYFAYGSAVSASLPLLAQARDALAGDRLLGFAATFSSTANWILTRVAEGADPDTALAEARQRGLTEADPALDLEGWDSAAKALILARSLGLAVGALDAARVRGLSSLDPAEVRRRGKAGEICRLVAHAASGSLEVAPRFVSAGDPLYAPDPLAKAAVLRTVAHGEVQLAGGRAGPAATAASLLSDLLGAARFLQAKGDPVESGDGGQPVQPGAGGDVVGIPLPGELPTMGRGRDPRRQVRADAAPGGDGQ
jgi:homoserine dehydrogenase